MPKGPARLRRGDTASRAALFALSFLLLLLAFRSIVVPVKAIVMNLLSTGAAYGLVAGTRSPRHFVIGD